LADADRHGYGIIKEVLERTDGEMELETGTLYTGFRRLKEDRLLDVVARRTALPGLVGLTLGLGGAWVASRFLGGLLFGVEAWDPVSYLRAALFLIGVMIAAAFIPAGRATSIMPMTVLRQD
jgi:hypothetical protein